MAILTPRHRRGVQRGDGELGQAARRRPKAVNGALESSAGPVNRLSRRTARNRRSPRIAPALEERLAAVRMERSCAGSVTAHPAAL